MMDARELAVPDCVKAVRSTDGSHSAHESRYTDSDGKCAKNNGPHRGARSYAEWPGGAKQWIYRSSASGHWPKAADRVEQRTTDIPAPMMTWKPKVGPLTWGPGGGKAVGADVVAPV